MTGAQTTACVAAAAETDRPPCPPWCNPDLHSEYPDYLVHYSDPSWFGGKEGFWFEAWIERHDELVAPWPDNTGDPDIGVRVHPEPGCFESDGWLEADAVRELGMWLITLADLCDRHRTNGRHVERRQAMTG